ncbi:hypothetical protein [Oryza sativa Japonica Group]|uniref:Uncharacterized protein n=1 Tax=Oryza sativa subsp. japonica TaxID=39947 RepID=Q5ZB56_ORYSJ|nr:hypothetical protein [Oryza sativa Japonica Group]
MAWRQEERWQFEDEEDPRQGGAADPVALRCMDRHDGGMCGVDGLWAGGKMAATFAAVSLSSGIHGAAAGIQGDGGTEHASLRKEKKAARINNTINQLFFLVLVGRCPDI